MTELFQASRQWATRPADERFLSLTALHEHCSDQMARSRHGVRSSRAIKLAPIAADKDHRSLVLAGKSGEPVAFTNWAFSQLAQVAKARTDYMKFLPAPLAVDCMNYGLQIGTDAKDVGLLVMRERDNSATLRAVTGPDYGRVWNADVTRALCDNFGDGVNGRFRIPAEFGKRAAITAQNTTLYASDRDMFVFLADEDNRITIPDRRGGQSGQLARGFFIWNSEVGKTSLGICAFLYDYMCGNHIVWGAEDIKELRIRHTSGAPEKFVEEVIPALKLYANSSAQNLVALIENSRKAKVGDADAVAAFLRERFSGTQADAMIQAHLTEEGRPIESLWDMSTAITAYARQIEYMDARIEIEREAGKVLKLAA